MIRTKVGVEKTITKRFKEFVHGEWLPKNVVCDTNFVVLLFDDYRS
jgi:hypothetical protein